MKISSLASVILLAIAVPVGLAQTNKTIAVGAVGGKAPQPQPSNPAARGPETGRRDNTGYTATPGGNTAGGNASSGSILETNRRR